MMEAKQAEFLAGLANCDGIVHECGEVAQLVEVWRTGVAQLVEVWRGGSTGRSVAGWLNW